MFENVRNYLSVIYYIIFINLIDLSNFYLKYVLWLPSSHYLLFIRLNFWAFTGIISTREYYDYVKKDFKIPMGWNCWLQHIILFAEWMLILKNSQGQFPETMPIWLQWSWSFIVTGVLTAALALYYKELTRKVNN